MQAYNEIHCTTFLSLLHPLIYTMVSFDQILRVSSQNDVRTIIIATTASRPSAASAGRKVVAAGINTSTGSTQQQQHPEQNKKSIVTSKKQPVRSSSTSKKKRIENRDSTLEGRRRRSGRTAVMTNRNHHVLPTHSGLSTSPGKVVSPVDIEEEELLAPEDELHDQVSNHQTSNTRTTQRVEQQHPVVSTNLDVERGSNDFHLQGGDDNDIDSDDEARCPPPPAPSSSPSSPIGRNTNNQNIHPDFSAWRRDLDVLFGSIMPPKNSTQYVEWKKTKKANRPKKNSSGKNSQVKPTASSSPSGRKKASPAPHDNGNDLVAPPRSLSQHETLPLVENFCPSKMSQDSGGGEDEDINSSSDGSTCPVESPRSMLLSTTSSLWLQPATVRQVAQRIESYDTSAGRTNNGGDFLITPISYLAADLSSDPFLTGGDSKKVVTAATTTAPPTTTATTTNKTTVRSSFTTGPIMEDDGIECPSSVILSSPSKPQQQHPLHYDQYQPRFSEARYRSLSKYYNEALKAETEQQEDRVLKSSSNYQQQQTKIIHHHDHTINCSIANTNHSKELVAIKMELADLKTWMMTKQNKLSSSSSLSNQNNNNNNYNKTMDKTTPGTSKRNHVKFSYPLITATNYRPKTEPNEITTLYFQESELLQWEKDRLTTVQDHVEVSFIGLDLGMTAETGATGRREGTTNTTTTTTTTSLGHAIVCSTNSFDYDDGSLPSF
jgi:hypothetical protein